MNYRRTITHCWFLIVVCGGLASPSNAQKSIKLNFNSSATVTESDGQVATATPSTLTAEQKAAVVMKVKQEYDDAGVGDKVMVMEGSGGDYDIIISGGTAPVAGSEYGDAGQAGKPGIVHGGEFVNAGLTGDQLVNAIEETAAHEAGHKLGLPHNWDNPPTKMTEGSKKTTEMRGADGRSFNASDKTTLKSSLMVARAEHTGSSKAGDLGVFVGNRLDMPPNQPDDRYFDAYATFDGPAGSLFGYFGLSNEFVLQGDTTNTSTNPAFMTFPYIGGEDLAVQVGTDFFSLSRGMSGYLLNNPNPNNPDVFLNADVFFALPGGAIGHIALNGPVDPGMSGFFSNPCTPGLFGENIAVVRNSEVAICVSDYGWSDTFFVRPIPSLYDQSLDVLSGDSAHNFMYTINGVLASGNGWLTRGMDGGQLVPSYSTGSPWTVTVPIHYVGGINKTQSVIHQPVHGLDIMITTEVVGPSVVQTFNIMNNGKNILDSTTFADYFNYHANGSLPPDVQKETITYQGLGGFLSTGMPDASFVANAQMSGTTLDDFHDAGFASPMDTIRRVENGTYNGLGTFGPGDAAGALAWRLGALAPGQSISITTTISRAP